MDSELQTHELQLSQVTEALEADPSNQELQTLQKELQDLVTLIKSSLPRQQQASSSSTSAGRNERHARNKATSSSPAPAAAAVETARPLKAGDECTAKYATDGRWYPARVASVSGSSKDPVYTVIFKGYNNTEMVRSHDIRSSASSEDNTVTAALGTSTDSSKKRTQAPTLTPEEEAERERKRKRNEKKAERRENKTQEMNNKANSWQKFAKKGAKKGYGIAGEKSMFKTPDDPLAKVGVVGAGRGMSKTQGRSRHVFEE